MGFDIKDFNQKYNSNLKTYPAIVIFKNSNVVDIINGEEITSIVTKQIGDGFYKEIIGLIIAVVVVKVCNTNGKFKTNYDERQQIMIGKSYKCAMITAWILLAIYIVIDAGGNKLPMENSMVAFTIMFISVMVFG